MIEQDILALVCKAWVAGAPAVEIARAARVPLVRVSQIVFEAKLPGRDHTGAPIPHDKLVAMNEAHRSLLRVPRTRAQTNAALERVAAHLARAA